MHGVHRDRLNMKRSMKEWPRHAAQSVWAVLTNSYGKGFLTGKIYQGNLKKLCVPGMNCYSCPGARGACPIGSLQAVIGNYNYSFSYYLAGFLIFIGAMIGRFVCGWLCPFGLIQDLLYKIPGKKIKLIPGDKILRKLKYVFLGVFVILLPLVLTDVIGQGSPYFCKLVCPVGTLEGGIPMVLLNQSMRGAIGFIYLWKNTILIALIILSILWYRPFCKYICPLGAIYSFFNGVSVFRYQFNKEKCVSCGACRRACKMQIDPVKNCNSAECIRCGQCLKACPTKALQWRIPFARDKK